MSVPNMTRLVVAIVALLIVSILVQAAHAAPTDADGYPLPVGCRANVAVNTGHGWPHAAIESIVGHGGTVTIDGVGPDDNPALAIQITVNGWTLYEDSGLWIDLRDYEIDGTCLETTTNTVYLPFVASN